MDTAPSGRRRILLHSLTLLIHELGYERVEDGLLLETLLEMFQGVLTELSRTTRSFTELSNRVEPNTGDVVMAMSELGLHLDPSTLRSFIKRGGRSVIPPPQGQPLVKNPTILSVGKRRGLPSYVPEYFPPMPDPHTYIRTPTHRQPLTDYATCRERASQHCRDLERSLAKFYARTLPCSLLFPEHAALFPFIAPKPVTYTDHLVPRDQLWEEEGEGGGWDERINMRRSVVEGEQDGGESGDGGERWELIDNPFLRPPVKAGRRRR